MKRLASSAAIFAAALSFAPAVFGADETYKIGVPVGLTGYASLVDHAWRDGLLLAVKAVNARGGAAGRKLELVVEDNHSQPQDAVIAYKKMISSDRVQLFDSGCVSAGNFAAAGSVVQAKIPNLTCGVLPPSPEQRKWMFGMRLPGRFELDVRLAYLRDHTAIRQIGVLHDSTPYSQIQRDLALKTAGDYGITVVDTQFYNQDDADLSVQIAHMRAAGAAAILKIGTGGSTLTAAKNIVQLGLSMPLLASSDDLSTFRAATAALGDKFFFAAAPAQAVDALPPGPAKDAVEAFLKIWSAEYGERDGSVAAHAWDSIMLLAQAIAAANSSDGTAIRDAMERLPPYQGAGGLYEFTPEDHEVKLNALRLVQIRDGHVVLAQ